MVLVAVMVAVAWQYSSQTFCYALVVLAAVVVAAAMVVVVVAVVVVVTAAVAAAVAATMAYTGQWLVPLLFTGLTQQF